jgi:hypothetical protein
LPNSAELMGIYGRVSMVRVTLVFWKLEMLTSSAVIMLNSFQTVLTDSPQPTFNFKECKCYAKLIIIWIGFFFIYSFV